MYIISLLLICSIDISMIFTDLFLNPLYICGYYPERLLFQMAVKLEKSLYITQVLMFGNDVIVCQI